MHPHKSTRKEWEKKQTSIELLNVKWLKVRTKKAKGDMCMFVTHVSVFIASLLFTREPTIERWHGRIHHILMHLWYTHECGHGGKSVALCYVRRMQIIPVSAFSATFIRVIFWPQSTFFHSLTGVCCCNNSAEASPTTQQPISISEWKHSRYIR